MEMIEEERCRAKYCKSTARESGFCHYHEWEDYRNSIGKKMHYLKCKADGCTTTEWHNSGFCRRHLDDARSLKNLSLLDKRQAARFLRIKKKADKRALITEGRRQKREEIAQEMLAFYRTGVTLDTVGEKYGVTRERVRQVITVIPGYVKNKHLPKIRIRTCKLCGKTLSEGGFKQYCSLTCKIEGDPRRKYRTPEEIEKKKEAHRLVVRRNYHEKYKHLQSYKERAKLHVAKYHMKLRSRKLREKAENMARVNKLLEERPFLKEMFKLNPNE